MQPDISEFSYGFALTDELIRSRRLRGLGAPTFPNLVQEGGLGYDVQLPGTPVFLQFKLSDPMVRTSARESHLLGVPYYRMHLRRRDISDQHKLLLELENQGSIVLYACPEFHTAADLNVAFDTQSVVHSSAFWRPSDIGHLSDDDPHYIAFLPNAHHGYYCSEPRRIDKHSAPMAFKEPSPRLRDRRRVIRPEPPVLAKFADELIDLYAATVEPSKRPLADIARKAAEGRSPGDYARAVAQTLFDCLLAVSVFDDNAA